MSTHRGSSGFIGIAAVIGAALAGLVGATAFLGMLILTPLPPPKVPVASTVYDINGKVVARLFVENRTEVPLSYIPTHLRHAVVSIEDDRFYRHIGIDPIGIARALYVDIRERRVVQGGSTITQQLARNLYLTPERTIWRKLREAYYTLKLEAHYSKDEILRMYLNQIYLGTGSYGVEAAAWTYFGKSVRDLDLAESATIAGLIRSPENYSPFKDPDLCKKRRNTVLRRMFDLGYISTSELDWASSRPLGARPKPAPTLEAPYFVEYIVDQIRQSHPEIMPDLYQGGYRLYTTLNLDMQHAAEEALNSNLPRGALDESGVVQPQGAIVAIEPGTGFIKAMVGGRDFNNTPLNRATQVRRQPGSAFKPFVYVAVLDRGFPPTATKTCEPVSYPGATPERPYQPADYGEEKYHYRPMTIREAIAISDNVVAVKWAAEVGPEAISSYARRLGIQSDLQRNLSLALGTSEVSPLEMAASFAALANSGYRVEPVALLKLEDRWGHVIEKRVPRLTRAIDPRVAYVITDLMKGVVRPGGTAGFVEGALGRPVAGKTGTTENLVDAWFVGYTPDLCAAVYVGYDRRERALPGSGGTIAAPIWASFMKAALKGSPIRDFERPPGIVEVAVCTETGLVANPTCPAQTEVFIEGTEPSTGCPLYH